MWSDSSSLRAKRWFTRDLHLSNCQFLDDGMSGCISLIWWFLSLRLELNSISDGWWAISDVKALSDSNSYPALLATNESWWLLKRIHLLLLLFIIQVFYHRQGVVFAAVQSAHVHNMFGLPAVVFPLHRSQQSRLQNRGKRRSLIIVLVSTIEIALPEKKVRKKEIKRVLFNSRFYTIIYVIWDETRLKWTRLLRPTR